MSFIRRNVWAIVMIAMFAFAGGAQLASAGEMCIGGPAGQTADLEATKDAGVVLEYVTLDADHTAVFITVTGATRADVIDNGVEALFVRNVERQIGGVYIFDKAGCVLDAAPAPLAILDAVIAKVNETVDGKSL